MDTNLNIAVLIDGDNIPSAYISEMIEEVTKYGNPTIKRIYGDWTRPGLKNGKTFFLKMQSLLSNSMDIRPEKMLQIQLWL